MTDGKRPVVGLHLQMTKPCSGVLVELRVPQRVDMGVNQMHAITHSLGHFVGGLGLICGRLFLFQKQSLEQRKFKASGCTAELWPPLRSVPIFKYFHG